MRKTSEQLVTRTQLETIYTAWGVTAAVPRGKAMEIVCFPYVKEHAQVSRTAKKNDNGQHLYNIEFFVH